MKSYYDAYKHINQFGVNQCFVDACSMGNLEEAKYLLLSNEIKYNADIHFKEDYAFRSACYKGHLDIVKYLLTSPELSEHANIHAQDDTALWTACEKGHFDIVKYLLTSEDLKEKAKINSDSPGSPLSWASLNNHLEIVKYLLTSPELSEHADLHSNEDEPFCSAYKKGHLDILRYFVFELNIPKTNHIEKQLKELPNQEVEHMFNLRYLNKDLNTNLSSNDYNVRRNKI